MCVGRTQSSYLKERSYVTPVGTLVYAYDISHRCFWVIKVIVVVSTAPRRRKSSVLYVDLAIDALMTVGVPSHQEHGRHSCVTLFQRLSEWIVPQQ